MNRRTAGMLLAAGVLPSRVGKAQHQMARAAKGPYTPQFFTKEEFRFLDELAEMILPADDHSPGAREARVADYVDLVVANSGASVQKQWRDGIREFGGSAFLAEGSVARATRIGKAASEEKAPASGAGKFFALMKSMVLRGYYTSETGIRKELGYKGPEVLSKFPGCTG